MLHLDHLGLLESTKKNYRHLLVAIDAFTKFTWIFPTKSTGTNEVLNKIQILQQTFGNPRRIITDRGTAFTSNDFKEYCENEAIHTLITTGITRQLTSRTDLSDHHRRLNKAIDREPFTLVQACK